MTFDIYHPGDGTAIRPGVPITLGIVPNTQPPTNPVLSVVVDGVTVYSLSGGVETVASGWSAVLTLTTVLRLILTKTTPYAVGTTHTLAVTYSDDATNLSASTGFAVDDITFLARSPLPSALVGTAPLLAAAGTTTGVPQGGYWTFGGVKLTRPEGSSICVVSGNTFALQGVARRRAAQDSAVTIGLYVTTQLSGNPYVLETLWTVQTSSQLSPVTYPALRNSILDRPLSSNFVALEVFRQRLLTVLQRRVLGGATPVLCMRALLDSSLSCLTEEADTKYRLRADALRMLPADLADTSVARPLEEVGLLWAGAITEARSVGLRVYEEQLAQRAWAMGSAPDKIAAVALLLLVLLRGHNGT